MNHWRWACDMITEYIWNMFVNEQLLVGVQHETFEVFWHNVRQICIEVASFLTTSRISVGLEIYAADKWCVCILLISLLYMCQFIGTRKDVAVGCHNILILVFLILTIWQLFISNSIIYTKFWALTPKMRFCQIPTAMFINITALNSD